MLDEPPRGPARKALHSRIARETALGLLRESGVDADAIGRGPEGQPLWPAGWVGSLAHTHGAAAAVIGPGADSRGLGIDIEPDLPLPDDVARMVVRADEAGAEGRAIFCAKECVHKAIYPATGAWLDFRDVRIVFGTDGATFRPEPATDKAREAFAGSAFSGVLWRVDRRVVAVLRLAREFN